MTAKKLLKDKRFDKESNSGASKKINKAILRKGVFAVMDSHELKWFIIRIIKQIIVEGEPDPFLLDELYEDDVNTFEESFMIYHASDEQDVYNKAQDDIMNNESSYMNPYGQIVKWKLIKIVDCYEIIDELKSGAEVYSCLHTVSKDTDALKFVSTYFKES